ncbi:hypothetical protein Trydic_g1038 [Trypoxylus dichotomus]
MPKRRESTVAERSQCCYIRRLAADLSIEQDVSVCDRTVRRRLAQVNLKGRKAHRKPYLSQQEMKNRLLWARKYKDWTVEDWSKVIWSGESNVKMLAIPRAQFVRRRPTKAFRADCITPTVKHGSGSVMI